jgi:hypothetical protein
MNSVVWGQDNTSNAAPAFSSFLFWYYYFAFLKPAESGVSELKV